MLLTRYCEWNKTQINPISRYLIWSGTAFYAYKALLSPLNEYSSTILWCWWWYLCAWLLSCCEPFHGHLNSVYNGMRTVLKKMIAKTQIVTLFPHNYIYIQYNLAIQMLFAFGLRFAWLAAKYYNIPIVCDAVEFKFFTSDLILRIV